MNKNLVIQAHHLTKKYGSFTAVNDIDFSIYEGECFGFLGPNGAGKTTTMKILYCLSPHTAGTVEIMGMNPVYDSTKIKSLIGVVAQDNNLDPELTVEENLAVYSRFFGIPSKIYKKRIDELLSFMSLDKKRKARMRELSGGMKRRLVLVRALLNNPKILVLDEPTTGLDPQVRHLIWEKLRELKMSGVTMLLTTHYMEEASQLCDRLVIMHEGNFLLMGNPQELIKKHTPRYVLEFSINGNKNSEEIKTLGKKAGCYIDIYGSRCYAYSDSDRVLEQLMEDIKADQKLLRNSTLEDLFLKLTGRGLNE